MVNCVWFEQVNPVAWDGRSHFADVTHFFFRVHQCASPGFHPLLTVSRDSGQQLFFVFLPLPMMWLAQWLADHDDTSLHTSIDKRWWWAPKSWFPCLAWTEGSIGSAKCQCHSCHSATCSSVVIAVYMGATGKDVPERKKAARGQSTKKTTSARGQSFIYVLCTVFDTSYKHFYTDLLP